MPNRRDQHTDSRSINDTHHDSEIRRHQQLANQTGGPDELDHTKIVFGPSVVVSSNLLKNVCISLSNAILACYQRYLGGGS